MRTRPAPRTFRSGELAPWLDGITNQITAEGLRTLENWIVKKNGQATRRPGSYFVKEVKDSSKAAILIPVVIDDINRYLLEVGDLYIRVYDQPTHAYNSTELTSPWSVGDISDLRSQYIPAKKALVVADGGGDYALRRIAWASGTSWTITQSPTDAFNQAVLVTDNGRVYRSEDMSVWDIGKIDITEASAHNMGRAGTNSRKLSQYFITDWGNAKLYSSTDAVHWISVGPSAFLPQNTAAIGVDSFGTIAIGGAAVNDIWVSDDGSTWAQGVTPTASGYNWETIAYDEITGNWRGSTEGGGVRSTDGRSWSSGPGPAMSPSRNMRGYNDFWLAVGSFAIKYATSIGAAWTTAVSVTNHIFSDVEYSPNTPLWIAVKSEQGNISTGSGAIYTSPTGTVWSRVLTTGSGLKAALWLHAGFYVFGYGQNYYKSPDGATWTTLTENNFDATDYVVSAFYDVASDAEWFDTTNHFPMGVISHEGRVIIGPTKIDPARIWSSKTGVDTNFYQGDISSDGWNYALTGEGNVDIQWMMGVNGGIVVGTRTAEGMMIGSPDEGITPLTAQFRWLSTFGSANIQPVRIHDTIIFVQRGGEIIRGYVPAANAYQSPELTEFADHIASGGVVSLDHQDDPQSIVYAVRSDGQLLNLTFGEGLRAWSRTVAAPSVAGAAVIESVAVIPTTGAEDEIWMVVRRTIGGATKRYIEYMDTLQVASFQAAHYLDCGVYATAGTSFQTVGALTHLAGENVDAFISAPAANVRWIQGLTVAASGTITTAPYSGTAIHVGLPYTSYLQTLRSDYGSPWGSGAGLNKKTLPLVLWVSASSALAKFGPTTGTAVESILYSSSTTLVTEEIIYPFPGQYDRDNYIWCIVTDPRPFTLVAMVPDTETADN